jgi:hypothetical protein
MSEITIHRTLTNSATDNTTRERHDQVVFENVADQYAKGQDVTAHFTVLNDAKIDASEHQIGLLRVGSLSQSRVVHRRGSALGRLHEHSRMRCVRTRTV